MQQTGRQFCCLLNVIEGVAEELLQGFSTFPRFRQRVSSGKRPIRPVVDIEMRLGAASGDGYSRFPADLETVFPLVPWSKECEYILTRLYGCNFTTCQQKQQYAVVPAPRLELSIKPLLVVLAQQLCRSTMSMGNHVTVA